MLESILLMLGIMNHTTKKEDVVKSAQFIFTNLNDDVLPALTEAHTKLSFAKLEDANLLTITARTAGISYKDNKDIIGKIIAGMTNINKERNAFIELLEKELPDIITDKTATAKDVAILRVVNDLAGMNSFLLDFVYLLIADKASSELPAIKFKNIRLDATSFAEAYKVYGDKNFPNVIKEVKLISNSVIDTTASSSMLNVMLGKTGKLTKLPTASGFVNNPIYHIRMWMVDREIVKYESLKDKKRLIELRIMELKLKENGESDPELRKQIEYYESKLSTIEYKIAKIDTKE